MILVGLATSDSLVLIDEVGRGTTVDDGLAIAFATVHHLLTVNKCRAMFATHFHEIADLLGYTDDHKGRGEFSGISFFCTGVDEMEVSRLIWPPERMLTQLAIRMDTSHTHIV